MSALQAIAFVAATVFCVFRTHRTQAAGAHPTRILQQQQYVGTRKVQPQKERGAISAVLFRCLCCLLLLCTCNTPKLIPRTSTLWQSWMVQQPPYFKVLFLWKLRTLLFLCITCVSIMWACYPEHNNLDDSNPRILWISKAPANYCSGTVAAAAAAAVRHQRTSLSDIRWCIPHPSHPQSVYRDELVPDKSATFHKPKTTTQSISTRRRQQREHVGESVFGVRAVVSEIEALFVLLGEALLHRDLIGRL